MSEDPNADSRNNKILNRIVGSVAVLAFLSLVGFVADLMGITNFVTGKSLGELVSPDKAQANSIRAIALPPSVYGYKTYGHETRSSHLFQPEEVRSTAYSYGYYQNDESIWVDASVAAGGDTISVVSEKRTAAAGQAQGRKVVGATSCYWRPDADPNTPRHEVVCYRLDEARQLAIVVGTHTADVGELAPVNLTDEIWNRLTVS